MKRRIWMLMFVYYKAKVILFVVIVRQYYPFISHCVVYMCDY